MADEPSRTALKVMCELGNRFGLDTDKVLAEVRENILKLEACPLHDFEPVPDGRPFARKHRCNNCGGTTDSLHASWYKRGLEHGRNAK